MDNEKNLLARVTDKLDAQRFEEGSLVLVFEKGHLGIVVVFSAKMIFHEN